MGLIMDRTLIEGMLDYEASNMAYSTTAVEDIPVRIYYLCSLTAWTISLKRDLAKCVDNIHHGECREVLGLDYKKLMNKGTWLQGRLLKDKEEWGDMSIEEFGCPYGCKTASELFAKYEEAVDDMIDLLKEAKMTFSNPVLFEDFINQMRAQHKEAPIIADYEHLKEKEGDTSMKALCKIQALIFAKLVNKGILRFEDICPEELEKVNVQELKCLLPVKYPYCKDFNEEWGKFMKYIQIKKGVYVVDRVRFRKYVLSHVDEFTQAQMLALYEFVTMVKLVHEDMAKENAGLAKHLVKELPDINQEKLNYFAPALHIKEMLSGTWFAKRRTSVKYTQAWIIQLIDDFMESQWGEYVARDWLQEERRDLLKAGVLGSLKEAGVIDGSNLGMAKFIINGDQKQNNTFARYIGDKKYRPFSHWFCMYVK